MTYMRFKGIGVSPGIAIGEASLAEKVLFTAKKDIIGTDEVENEIKKLQSAILQTKKQLTHIKNQVKKKIGKDHSFIFEAHLMLLEDKSLCRDIEKIIKRERAKVEWAISRVHDKYVGIFDAIEDEYFKQRKSDVTDVLSKIYRNLKSIKQEKKDEDSESILVAHDLLPSEAAMKLGKGNVLAVALDAGGQTSHTAILARSLNIPAVVGLHEITQKVSNGDLLIVDGTDGEVIINPPLAIRKEFLSKKRKYDDYCRELKKTATLDSITLDKVRFYPMANIELPEEVKLATSMGAEGVGLFRSEFIYFQKSSLPEEEEHFRIYSQVAKDAFPSPVYIRTIDIGGEKNLPQLNIEKEANPALGLRAIRFSLQNKELLKVQVRAILRASTLKNVKILIPMITEIEEIEEVKMIISKAKNELRKEGRQFDENIPLGAMIEVPAAAALTDIIIKEVDYISIGTNDLIQYYLAVDRSNELVSYLFKPLHPSVLRLIRFVIKTVQKENKEVTVCGEMAADPLSALALLGLGLRKFSMNPIFIPRIKQTLRSVEHKKIEEIVQNALTFKTAQHIEEYLLEQILVKYPKAFLMGKNN
ncbi:MAG: phosphoenolpyruvate--protein phosphotransferase [Candidatus Aminicenantes bacterium]|nr:phosphoenolpyruvate--protein phosphotransferase [Candidatus Aminicenantes bacterium]